VALVLSFFIFKEHSLIFIASEILIIISAVLAWRLYQELVQPLNMLMQGTEAIKDKDFNVKFVHTGKYEMDQLINVYNQMIDELRIERVKQEQQHFFLEKMIHTSPTGIILLDYEDNIQQINPKALELLSVEEKDLLGRSIHDLHHPIIKQITQLKSGEAKTITLSGAATYKLQKSHFIDRGFARHFIMIEELTAEILAAEKKAYGKVIRMMAHEVNNTIGPVNSILESTLKTPTLWKENKHDSLLDALQVAIQRNQNLNLFMRNFADVVRLPVPSIKQINLHYSIHAVAKLMELRAAERHIQFEFSLAKDPFYISADEQQVEQVLINVVKNAMEAIETKGKIVFTTDLQSRKLVITDTGKGIPAEVAEQLFSPFFSTRKDGQGIGLTLIKEILLSHGFEFSLRTISPQQTEFVIEF
jgi:two-component system nitrogen regulation sensor histidine kinase NtrY